MKFLNAIFSKPAPQTSRPDPDPWSIGIYQGATLKGIQDPGGDINPVITPADLTDVDARLVADPFMLNQDGLWNLFFEAEINTPDGPIGKIGHAVSENGFNWTYQGIVLAEPFHLSYPYVFKSGREIYMVPETRSARSVRLYRARHFPGGWSFVKTLLKGRRFADNSLFFYNGLWWMFTDSGNHTLRLYHAAELLGPWKEHRKSPILKKNPSFARPGGRVIIQNNVPIRFAQDAYPVYGSQVWGFKITCLTTRDYQEIPMAAPVIKASGSGWNEKGMHTIDPHSLADGGIIACVDGLARQ